MPSAGTHPKNSDRLTCKFAIYQRTLLETLCGSPDCAGRTSAQETGAGRRARRCEGGEMNITHGLRRALQVNPQGIAILEEERRLSWAEVGERVSRLAGALGQLGIAKGDRIAVLMLNSSRYLELYPAVGWAAAVLVPLNIRWSVAENRDALQDSVARLLVIDNAFVEAGEALA